MFFCIFFDNTKFDEDKMRIKELIIILIISVVSYSQTVNIKIIETSDVHGAIYPYNFTTQKEAGGSLARVQTYLNIEKNKSDQQVILLDNGDILQGTPAVYYFNFEKPEREHLYARVMNYMKYDAGTVGNHDIETGHSVYDRFRKEISFPWLAANALDTVNNTTYFKPYTVLEKKGVKIAVLGLITPGIPNWLPYNIWKGIEFEDKIQIAKEWVPKILAEEKPDILVGLFHAGVDYTYGNVTADSYRNENATKLIAEQVPGFDIIFVGHDHKTWNFKVRNSKGKDVLILGPTSGARNITAANIILKKNENTSGWEKEISGEIIDMKAYQPDPDFINEFSPEFDEIKSYVSREIGELTSPLDSRKTLFGDSEFSDLIHTVQLDLTGADISFTAPLSLNSVLNKGPLYIKDMFDLYRYENLLYSMKMTGKEIDGFMEYSYSLWFNEMNSSDDHLLMFATNDDGSLMWSERSGTPLLKNRYYNFDSAEGIEYTVDLTKPAGNKVDIHKFTNNKPFCEDSVYTVAINSYRGNGGGGHLTEGAGIPKDSLSDRIIYSTEKDLRFYLMKWIEKKKTIIPQTNNNWNVVPTDWYNSAKEGDYNLLYGSKD